MGKLEINQVRVVQQRAAVVLTSRVKLRLELKS